MKQIFALLGFALLCSCSTISSDHMQPDGSYKIVANRTGGVSNEALKEEAYNKARVLCPDGFHKRSEYKNGEREIVLVVKCKYADEPGSRIPSSLK